MLLNLSRRLMGPRLPQRAADDQKLSSVLALPILASDALSSVAYATEAALGVLVLAGSAALGLSLPITAVIALLIVVVVFSYRQTIEAYPQGGGAYVVSRENLGSTVSLVAAASLLEALKSSAMAAQASASSGPAAEAAGASGAAASCSAAFAESSVVRQ
jgi:amino acid transporter